MFKSFGLRDARLCKALGIRLPYESPNRLPSYAYGSLHYFSASTWLFNICLRPFVSLTRHCGNWQWENSGVVLTNSEQAGHLKILGTWKFNQHL